MIKEDHYIIGLTGNMGSGKSTVLNMLRHLGTYGIDADELTRKAYQQAEITEKIMNRFGTIEKESLASIVFSDARALVDLENILHPRVTALAKALIQNATLPVIVIEAIKLIESDLALLCDAIWVVDANQDIVTERLKNIRGMSETEIIRRLGNQSPLSEKMKSASVLIDNSKSYEKTWLQINKAWNMIADQGKNSTKLKQTIDCLDPFSPFLVHPFSSAHDRILSILQQQKTPQWIPGKKSVTDELINRWVCERFIMSNQNVGSSEQFVVWDLNTLSFTLHAIFGMGLTVKPEKPAFDTALAESFANLHLVESLITPSIFPFNNSSGYEMDIKVQEYVNGTFTTGWHNAGYNLIHKQLRDVSAYLEESLKLPYE